MNTDAHDTFCSRVALEEPLMGTIKTPARLWLLIEYTGAWRERAIEDNDLPDLAQQWLGAFLAERPGAKALFVKQKAPAENVRVTLAETDTGRMWRVNLPELTLLPTLSVDKLLRDDPPQARYDGPLMVVCTNGKRDACCAKYGLETYNALTADAPFEVWQSTHITGHRYAATGIAFPAGVYYGRMNGASAAIREAVGAGRIALPYYRGRAHHSRPAQIADALLRDALKLYTVDALRVEDAPQDFTRDVWQVTFSTPQGAAHRVTCQRAQVGVQAASACSTPEGVPVYAYNLLQVDTLPQRK